MHKYPPLTEEQRKRKSELAKERYKSLSNDDLKALKKKHAENYKENKERIKSKMLERVALAKEHVIKYKEQHPCTMCGEPDPVVLDFHHEDPALKENLVSYLVYQGRDISTIDYEIAKCTVLCSNCHRRVHYRLAREATPCDTEAFSS